MYSVLRGWTFSWFSVVSALIFLVSGWSLAIYVLASCLSFCFFAAFFFLWLALMVWRLCTFPFLSCVRASCFAFLSRILFFKFMNYVMCTDLFFLLCVLVRLVISSFPGALFALPACVSILGFVLDMLPEPVSLSCYLKQKSFNFCFVHEFNNTIMVWLINVLGWECTCNYFNVVKSWLLGLSVTENVHDNFNMTLVLNLHGSWLGMCM